MLLTAVFAINYTHGYPQLYVFLRENLLYVKPRALPF